MKILNWHILTEKDLQHEFIMRDQLKDHLIEEYRNQVKNLRKKVDGDKLLGIINIDIGDPTPEDAEARRAYVARVAGFHKDVLEKKCVQMISVFHKLLEEETNTRETDNILKIGIYVCREWLKWGAGAVNEQISYQTEPPLTPGEQKEEIITQIKL